MNVMAGVSSYLHSQFMQFTDGRLVHQFEFGSALFDAPCIGFADVMSRNENGCRHASIQQFRDGETLQLLCPVAKGDHDFYFAGILESIRQ